MFVVLYAISGVMFVIGVGVLSVAETSFHEITAALAFVCWAIFFSGAVVAQNVKSVASCLEEEEEDYEPVRRRR